MSFIAPELGALFDLWRAKADRAGGLPRREDLDIRLLQPFLRHLSILERVAVEAGKSRYRIRLQGTLLARYFGEQTGKMLEESVPRELAERWTCVYDALLEAWRPLHLLGTYEEKNIDHLAAEALVLPLGNGEAPPVCVLSAAYFTPRRRSAG